MGVKAPLGEAQPATRLCALLAKEASEMAVSIGCSSASPLGSTSSESSSSQVNSSWRRRVPPVARLARARMPSRRRGAGARISSVAR